MPDYFDTGFAVRQPSWHGKEDLLEVPPDSWDEGRQAAGLTWEPQLAPVYAISGNLTHEIPGWNRVVRSDTGDTLHIAPDTYQPIRHGRSVDIGADGELVELPSMEPLAEAIMEQGAQLETMGSVRDGRQVYATFLLDEPFRTTDIDRSLTLPYVVLLNAHDGSGALVAAPTMVRVVCANTWKAAFADTDRRGELGVRIKHTSEAQQRIEDAALVLSNLRASVAAWRDLAGKLAAVRATAAAVDEFLERFMPYPPERVHTERKIRHVDASRDKWRQIYAGETVTGAGIGGTALGLVEATGEFLDHGRRWRTRDSYIRRTLIDHEPLKSSAIRLAREVCGAV